MTIPTQLVLGVFLAEPERALYGYELSDEAGLPTGTIHPILARLEGFGWLESRWEEVDPSEAGRPARRYYTLTGEGARAGAAALAKARRPRRSSLLPSPLPEIP